MNSFERSFGPDHPKSRCRFFTGYVAMADTPVNSPLNRTGTAPKPTSENRRSAEDDEIEEALEKALGKDLEAPDVSFKRQWDAGLQAELDAALADFDEASFNAPSPRSGKAAGPKKGDSERGHEGRPGARTGKVIGQRGKVIFVDLGGKSEGILPVTDFEDGQIPAPGSSIEVVVERFDPEEGVQILRLKGAAIEADWSNLKRGVTIEARVTKTVKGGLEVDVDGIRGFLPISQIDLSRVEDAASYVNQKFKAIVTEANQREKNLVISRRELMEQERAEQREKTWATLEEGQIRDGIIRSIKDFGAFVDIGGVDGLLPIGEMSWSRVSKVDEMVKTGDQVKVKVLKIDPVARKLTLGLKQLTPSPWQAATEKYPRGTMIKGKVSKIMDFGAFVELEPGIEGLIHISELSPTRVRRVVDIVKPAQEVEVRILKVEPEVKRIALSLLPDKKAVPTVAEEEEEGDDEEAPAPPRPEPKIPLKGGLGDREQRRIF
jgi:ribosomal protein S1